MRGRPGLLPMTRQASTLRTSCSKKDCLGMLPMTMATRQASGSKGTLPEDESLVLRASGSPSQIQSRD